MSRIQILLCVLYLSCTPKVNPFDFGGHSLLAFATYIKGDTPFPAFSAVLMLDDIEVGFFSSNHQKLIPRGPMKDKHTLGPSYQKNAMSVFTVMYEHMRARTHKLMYHYNTTYGVQFLQRIFGCDLLDKNTPGRMISKEAFNGESGDEKYLSIPDKTLETEFKWPGAWTALQSESIKWVIIDFYQPICIKTLHNLLHLNTKQVMRKVKPRLRLFQKGLSHSAGAQVTCLATGFYPRHINLTLLRDGQPVPDHQITGGQLLPNGDGTYQMRKSLEVSTEEVQHHQYTCTAQHLSLDNKLDISLDHEPRPGAKYVAIGVVIALISLLALIVAFIFCRRRCVGTGMKKEKKMEHEHKQKGEESSQKLNLNLLS
ncbi:hypothetical protein ACEWY4_000238 [Coilia grayii]|uniref:Ig-like domain-containing protein n=1 Tax=Coilia grayii TaxID=363190 RepID=A0ABD1KW30_9TELE